MRRKAVLCAVAVLASVGLLPATSHAAPSSHSAPRQEAGQNQGAPHRSCAKPLPVTVDTDGDVHHPFQLANGLVLDQIVPSSSLDPQSASSERIRKLGLPTRPPAGSADRPMWNGFIEGLKRQRTVEAPCVLTGVHATIASANYAGYRATAASGKNYSGAHASYTAPNYYLSTCVDESMTQWVGVGDGASTLAQAGVYVTQASGTVYSGGFYEFVGGPWDTGGLVGLHEFVPYVAGHRYYFDIHYVDRYDWHILVQDLDDISHIYDVNSYHSGAGATNYIQPLAYAVSERLLVSNGIAKWFTPYMNHSTVSFRATTAHIDGETDARFSIQRPEQEIMYSDGGTTLASVGALDSSTSNFTENWSACGAKDYR